MCTVTYIPPQKGRDFILTSNRDERVYRPALPPAEYSHGKVLLTYPKDSKAGGSWIAINQRGRVSCLLNGAFTAHQKKSYHTLSRGKILLDLAASEHSVQEFFMRTDLAHVEPSTIVTIDHRLGHTEQVSEFIWDGKFTHLRKMDKTRAHIWSSVTLYNEQHREMRQKWFNRFLTKNTGFISPEKVLRFHGSKHTNDHEINLIMERGNGLKTVSITQVVPGIKGFNMVYHDLIGKTDNVAIL